MPVRTDRSDAAPSADDPIGPSLGGRGGSFVAAPAAAVRRIPSEQLFNGAIELQIEHRGAIYRLKQTALGKLILTK